MNTQDSIKYIALFLALFGATSLLGETTNSVTARTWTSRSGQTVNAEFVKMQYGMVHLKREDGKLITIRSASLSSEDQKVAGKLASPATPSLKKAEPTESKKAPEIIYDLFGSKLRNAKKNSVSIDELSNKTIGVYFSAHWCPPCRAFTPKLVEFYNELKKSEKPFEIVFVSSDRNKSAMYKYMKEMEMPWLALPHGDKHKESLSAKYNVSGIPKLVILSSSGELITGNGRGEVMSGASVFEKWQASKKK